MGEVPECDRDGFLAQSAEALAQASPRFSLQGITHMSDRRKGSVT